MSPDAVIKNSHFESLNSGESWPVPSVPDISRLILQAYDLWVSNGKKKVFPGPRVLSTAIDFEELMNPSIPDIEIVKADGTRKGKTPIQLVTHP